MVSDLRLGDSEYAGIEKCRNEFAGWRAYYLDPRTAMRRPVPPAEVEDIGAFGEKIAPFLYRLQQTSGKQFDAVERLLRTLVPSVENVTVDLDRQAGWRGLLLPHPLGGDAAYHGPLRDCRESVGGSGYGL